MAALAVLQLSHTCMFGDLCDRLSGGWMGHPALGAEQAAMWLVGCETGNASSTGAGMTCQWALCLSTTTCLRSCGVFVSWVCVCGGGGC